ncbi:MAG: hypothetical protein FD127_3133 [Acidimicrobiaceae bacterium]|nr:MAG: hypothetical protein FD127_3133 [Acidimicrobiaceae bacterium]
MAVPQKVSPAPVGSSAATLEHGGAQRATGNESERAVPAGRGIDRAEQHRGLVGVAEEQVGHVGRVQHRGRVVARRLAVGGRHGQATACTQRGDELLLQPSMQEGHTVRAAGQVGDRVDQCRDHVGFGTEVLAEQGDGAVGVVRDLEARQLLHRHPRSHPPDAVESRRQLGRHRVGQRSQHRDVGARPGRGQRGVQPRPSWGAHRSPTDVDDVERGPADHQQPRPPCGLGC